MTCSTIPTARIARVSWWRRLRAWLRRRPIRPQLTAPMYPAYTEREQATHERLKRDGPHLHVFGKRCPDCTLETLLAVMRTPRAEIEFEIHGVSIDKPAPTMPIPGPGERVSK